MLFTQEPTPSLQHLFLELAGPSQFPLRLRSLSVRGPIALRGPSNGCSHAWSPPVRRPAVQELARGWKDDPDTLPILKQRATSDKNPNVRRAAIQELAHGWKEDPDVRRLLNDLRA